MNVKSILNKVLILAAFSAFALTAARADEAMVRPVPVKTPPPVYPAQMRQDGIAGTVTVKIVVDESGNVAECSVSKSTRAEFEQPALEAIKRWKFKPASKDGTPVRSNILVPVQFSSEA
ncbi:MAG TPA: energy transducer TonB [Opitutaceae bacterium]|nr:energy transducer TonB [Opitutaceae bacterium]